MKVPRFDGISADELEQRLALPRVMLFDEVASTLDVALEAGAAGAESGTLIIAEAQTTGRGRGGSRWVSARGAGLWLTMIERSTDASSIELLSLRTGLSVARALDPFAGERVRVKWPNDLYVGRGKLAGTLIEARWRGGTPDWVAIGIGINVRLSDAAPNAAGLAAGVERVTVLAAVVPALRQAASAVGPLSATELSALAERDFALGRHVRAPGRGRVEGISPVGELLVRAPDGALQRHRAGSLVFAEEA